MAVRRGRGPRPEQAAAQRHQAEEPVLSFAEGCGLVTYLVLDDQDASTSSPSPGWAEVKGRRTAGRAGTLCRMNPVNPVSTVLQDGAWIATILGGLSVMAGVIVWIDKQFRGWRQHRLALRHRDWHGYIITGTVSSPSSSRQKFTSPAPSGVGPQACANLTPLRSSTSSVTKLSPSLS
jgi:hypothetical protein